MAKETGFRWISHKFTFGSIWLLHLLNENCLHSPLTSRHITLIDVSLLVTSFERTSSEYREAKYFCPIIETSPKREVVIVKMNIDKGFEQKPFASLRSGRIGESKKRQSNSPEFFLSYAYRSPLFSPPNFVVSPLFPTFFLSLSRILETFYGPVLIYSKFFTTCDIKSFV